LSSSGAEYLDSARPGTSYAVQAIQKLMIDNGRPGAEIALLKASH
jgi:hypothetical protein